MNYLQNIVNDGSPYVLIQESRLYFLRIETIATFCTLKPPLQKDQIGINNFLEFKLRWIYGTVKTISTILNKDGHYLVLIDRPSKIETSFDQKI